MPNIELHGFGDVAEEKRTQIEHMLGMHCDGDQTITTVYPTSTRTLNGDSAPFLRIVASPKVIGKLIALLEPLNEDIEVSVLGQFIAKKTGKEVT